VHNRTINPPRIERIELGMCPAQHRVRWHCLERLINKEVASEFGVCQVWNASGLCFLFSTQTLTEGDRGCELVHCLIGRVDSFITCHT
jgi:hypothetical protein